MSANRTTDNTTVPCMSPTFRASLEEADPVLSSYCERFAKVGIHNKESLGVFCDFPRSEKGRFLSEHCGIAVPLESYRIRLALENAQEIMTTD